MLFHYIYLQIAHQADILFQNKSDFDFSLHTLIIILERNEFLF